MRNQVPVIDNLCTYLFDPQFPYAKEDYPLEPRVQDSLRRLPERRDRRLPVLSVLRGAVPRIRHTNSLVPGRFHS